uniref:Uncharacterized protein n=1 Tax=CrAss-like virus sp. ctyM420 TaxID=2828014 RepID=A0A8S5TJN0_9CAUD|nr:MAG TPA: hypothetical protein [CrAss-like virus sp. ctyM420]DAI31025.1 MAG TPA: hypothetical protein [Caudoviricetes sp.]
MILSSVHFARLFVESYISRAFSAKLPAHSLKSMV